MSIIIRLQNLPWNANAADIRQFFQNLTIPDGGVHIVGGENGDAFIAFGSDEDARQAMLMDGGKIKEAKIKLLLSSRTEMQKVIELARQQALTLQNLMQSMAAASSFGASPLSMLPNVLSGMSSVLPNLSSLQPAIAASANASASVAIPAPPTSADLKDIKSSALTESKTSAASATKNSGKSSSTKTDGKTRSRSISRSRSKSVSKSRSHSRSRSRSRSRDRRYRDRYRYGGSGKSRDRRRRDPSRSKDRSRSRDRYKKRSRSRERRNRDVENMYKSRDKRRTYDKKDKSPTHDDKDRNGHRKNSDGKSKPASVGGGVGESKPPPTQQQPPKNEITLLKVSPVKDAKASEPPSVDGDTVSSIVARILAKTKAGASESLEKPSNSNSNVATKIKTEITTNASKNDDVVETAPKGWMGSVPLPPMISSWMASQTTNHYTSATEPVKKATPSSEAAATSNENKSSNTACPPVMPPYSMYAARFPFGAGFPPAPTMYPFVGYPTPSAATGTGSAVPVAQPYIPAAGPNQATPMPMPPAAAFFNPYQRAAAVQPAVSNESSDQSLKTPHSRDYSGNERHGPSPKMPRLDSDDETKTERNNYNDGDFDHFKRPTSTNSSRPGNYPYYDDGDSKHRTYHNDNYNGDRRNNRFSSYDNNNYSYRTGRNDAYEDTSNNRRTYRRRDFSDADEIKTNDEFDRRANYNSTAASAYPGSVCVLVENLPSDTAISDIKRFFSPLLLYESSIKLQLDNKDDSCGKAFVKFLNFNDKLQALKYSGKILRSYRVSVSDMDSAVWEAAEDHVVALTDQQHLKVSFIPKRAQKQHLLDAFSNRPDDLILMKDGNKDALVAYVKFADSAMVKNILADRNKILICDSRVKLEPVSEEDFLVARADYQTCDDGLDVDNGQIEEASAKVNSNEFSKSSKPDKHESQSPKELKSNCVLMKNLPYPVTDLDICNFFSDLNVIPSQIHIMFDTNYKQTGDSYCEFATEEQAAEAVEKKNDGKMKYKAVTLQLVPREEVLKVIGNQLPDEEEEPSNPRPNNLPPPPNPKPCAPRFPAPAYGGPAPRFYSPRGPPPHARPPGPEQFGKPGCVVCLENVAYKAEVEDILEFFSEFNVQREHVIRRFNDRGLATGDARVCLRNAYEAQKAARCLDGQPILGRRVFIRLL